MLRNYLSIKYDYSSMRVDVISVKAVSSGIVLIG